MTDVMIRSLRVRGGGAFAFARVAATHLPHALDGALGDLADVSIDSLTVRLTVDPLDVDDATLAVLWANEIRAELLRGGARLRTGDPTVASDTQPPELVQELAPATAFDTALAAARAWLAAPVPRPAVPAAALRLVELTRGASHEGSEALAVARRLAIALATAIEPSGRATHALDSATDAATGHRSPAASGSPDEARPFAEAKPSSTAPAAPNDGTGTSVGRVEHEPAVPELNAALALTEALCDVAREQDEDVDLSCVTRAAGVVLLYPWLADVARTAMELNPTRDPATVRAQAFALLCDPHQPDPADPLLAFLAGWDPSDAPLSPLAHADEIESAAEAALSSFAGLLPGFTASSAHFIRQEWVRRVGVLDREREPVRLTAATHPLDVVLSRLPYPYELFALPWCPLLAVRFVP